MVEPAKQLFDDLDHWDKLVALLETGESEGLYLECKSPTSPQLSTELRVHLARALSGFSNTEGGIIIWGISTKRHGHSGLDVLTQIEPIGLCKQFAKQIETAIPTLTTPAITSSSIKCLFEKKRDKKGVVVTLIPKVIRDPVQVIADGCFYFRSGAEFTKAPHEMIKRLFAATESPDLQAVINIEDAAKDPNEVWALPINLANRSSAVGEHVNIFLEVVNPEACLEIYCPEFRDVSRLNRDKRVFSYEKTTGVIHRGVNLNMGNLRVKIAPGNTNITVKINVFANKMRAKSFMITLSCEQNKFTAVSWNESYIY